MSEHEAARPSKFEWRPEDVVVLYDDVPEAVLVLAEEEARHARFDETGDGGES